MEGWDRIGRSAGYGAAIALTPYLLIKVSWVVGSLVGLLPAEAGLDKATWVTLNTVTIGMAAVGIILALALVRPWGMRIPGVPLAFCAWVGAGFLVSMLPYLVLGSLLGSTGGASSGGGTDDGSSMPNWEGALIEFSFAGMAVGLALALPAYLRRRWPHAFAGQVGDGPRSGQRSRWVLVAGAALGAWWLYWAAGGRLGIAHPAARDSNGYLLAAVSGLWALVATAAVWTLGGARPARLPRWVPTVLGWLGSGSLFAWGGWKLPFTAYLAVAHPAGVTWPENLAVVAALDITAVVTGAAMARTLVRICAE
ncbi:hypothetical protein [Kitasatospora sp. GP82]|uniref:hypothetical protein n=1 Tax=Kitasatospora sp. GP82 TaxID=3035089 RepID=UPI002473BB89|nr:hypothetical protein [Kitasatospora sp. GP82]MDH6125016.1 hypothetical protein [Kitasatospora sp. GP82]